MAEHDLLYVAQNHPVLHSRRMRFSHLLWEKFNFTFLIHLELTDFIWFTWRWPTCSQFRVTCFLIGPKLYLLYSFYWVAWLQHEAGTCSFFHIASALIIACACRIPASSNWAVGKIWSRQIKKNQLSHRPKTVPGLQREVADQNWRGGRVMFSVASKLFNSTLGQM